MAISSRSGISDLSILIGLGLGNALTGLSVAFTGRASKARWGLFALQIAVLYHTVRDLSQTNNVLATFAGGSVCSILLQYIEQAFLNRWEFAAQGPTSTRGGMKGAALAPASKGPKRPDSFLDSIWNRFYFAASMMLQHRYPNTRWAVKGIPAFDARNPKAVPSRAAFLWRRTLQLVLLLLLLDTSAFLPRDPNHDTIFADARIPLLRRWNEVTAEEVATRAIGSAMFAIYGYAVIEAQYHTVALLHVASGLASPVDYPPLFGRFAQVYSLKQFWGAFWHQSFRRKLTAPAHYITHELLGLPRHTVISGTVLVSIIFGISGILHAVGDVLSGCRLKDSGAMAFFCMQPLGLMFETLVVATYTSLCGKQQRWPPAWAKPLGVLYVLVWMVWTGPSYMWLTLRVSEPALLRFSIIGLFLK